MNRNVSWGLLNISKLVITLVLIILTFVDLGMAVANTKEAHIFPVDFYTPVIKIASFVSDPQWGDIWGRAKSTFPFSIQSRSTRQFCCTSINDKVCAPPGWYFSSGCCWSSAPFRRCVPRPADTMTECSTIAARRLPDGTCTTLSVSAFSLDFLVSCWCWTALRIRNRMRPSTPSPG